jgi:Ca-activated chloride channel family protein
MKINALLDVNVVAVEAEDQVSVLLELEAPAGAVGDRAPSSLVVVLDRSGSMSGAPLEGAKRALAALVQRLDPTDNFGLVTFDDTAQLVVPAGPLTDKQAVLDRIGRIHAGGMTDLSAGYLRGLRELRNVLRGGDRTVGGTVLVISDGHVNSGITEASEIAAVAGTAYAEGVVTSTLGYGEGYDETMLAALARDGSGNHVFAADPDAAGVAIAAEVDGLLSKVVQAATLTVEFQPAVQMLRLHNDLPAQQVADGKVVIELGDLYAAEQRKLLMTLKVPAMAALGLARVATLELQYVELPGLVEHLVTLPIAVNVVPGDEAAKRIADPTVQSEVLFQQAQETKRRASEAFETGDLDRGRRLLAESAGHLDRALGVAPAGLVDDIAAEKESLEQMEGMTRAVGSAYMSKLTRDSYHQQNRKRGRLPRD